MAKDRSTLPQIGVVGLGLMSRGIATCLVANGYSVAGYDRTRRQAESATAHIREALEKLVTRKLLSRKRAHAALKRFRTVRAFRWIDGVRFRH
jgi:3-hydroxyacyl-CoA dehydrogenase